MARESNRSIDDLPALVWTATRSGLVDFVNRRWCEYTGVDAQDARGLRWQASIHSDDLQGLVDSWRSAAEIGEADARVRRFDGVFRWFHFRASLRSGGTNELYGVAVDVDVAKRGDEAPEAHWWLSPTTREIHFRSVADSIPALAALLTPAGETVLVNQQTLDYFGMTLAQLRAAPIDDTMHPDDHLRVISATQGETAERGLPYDFEVRLRRADGIYRWFQARGFPLRSSDGRIVLWYLLQTDIEERKRAEALLAGEKLLLERVARGEPLSVVLDALCRLLEAASAGTRCCLALVDRSSGRLELTAAPGLPARFVAGVYDLPMRSDASPCALATCANQQVIATDIAGDERWEKSGFRALASAFALRSCWSTPLHGTNGAVLGSLAMYHAEPRAPAPAEHGLIERFADLASIVVERAQTEDALKRSEAFLSETQRLSATGGFSWRVESNEIRWSEELYRIFEVDRSLPLSPEVTDSRVHPEDLPLLYEKVNRARDDGQDFEHEYRLLMPDHSIKHMHTVFHRTRDARGGLEYVGAIQDVTQRRRSGEALTKARSELAHVARVTSLGALTASIAHEVNQPLSGILTNANTCLRMLAAEPTNLEGARETARRTIRDATRASEVISRLRALFSKKEGTSELLDLNEIAREVIALSLSELQRARVVLQPQLSDALPLVAGDRVQLQQVVLNLLLNASEAMSRVENRPRQLLVSTRRADDDRVLLAVRDSGPGFDREAADRLFDAFYTTKPDGMGIGLSVSRSIIESHHGRLWAEPNDGLGATFAFSLPCVSTSAAERGTTRS